MEDSQLGHECLVLHNPHQMDDPQAPNTCSSPKDFNPYCSVLEGKEIDSPTGSNNPMETCIHDLQTLTGLALRQKYPCEYKAWENAKQRSKSNTKIKGKKFGNEFSAFPGFLREAGPRPDDSASLDRIDPTKGYLVGNVRWASKKLQSENRTNVKTFDVRGTQMTLHQFSVFVHKEYDAVRMSLSRGKTVEELLNESFAPPTQVNMEVKHTPKWPWPQGKEAAWERDFKAESHRFPPEKQNSRLEYLIFMCQKMLGQINEIGKERYDSAPGDTPPPELLQAYYYWDKLLADAKAKLVQELELKRKRGYGSYQPNSIMPTAEELELRDMFSGAPSWHTDEDIDRSDYDQYDD